MLFEQVFGGAILQQTVVVEFIVNGQMCDDCRRREAKDFWRAVVQVRQKVRIGACVNECASKNNSGIHMYSCG